MPDGEGAAAAAKDRQNPISHFLLDPHQFIEGLFNSPALGIALFDKDLHYVVVNDTLAAINGKTAQEHCGKTPREMIGAASIVVDYCLAQVSATGQPISNLEISAKLPTRGEQVHWIANFLPIKDITGDVVQIAVLVVEVTKLIEFERCILNLAGDLPRIRDQVIRTRLQNRAEMERVESWVSSILMLQGCLDEMRRISQFLPLPLVQDSEDRQIGLPYPSAVSEKSAKPVNATGNGGNTPLSLREREILKLLAMGKGNKEVASELKIQVKTVETYRAKIMLKLNIHSMTLLVHYAVRQGLIDT